MQLPQSLCTLHLSARGAKKPKAPTVDHSSVAEAEAASGTGGGGLAKAAAKEQLRAQLLHACMTNTSKAGSPIASETSSGGTWCTPCFCMAIVTECDSGPVGHPGDENEA